MIRRKWIIYDRKSRQIVSVTYHQRKFARNDLSKLNDYCGKKKYAMQLRRFDTEKNGFISIYPDIQLMELPKQEVKDG